jgi:hypothetical protein
MKIETHRTENWRLKGAHDWDKYHKLRAYKLDYEAKEHWRQTRTPPREYRELVDDMWYNGIDKLWLRSMTKHADPNFLSIEVALPEDWKYLLTNAEGEIQKNKRPDVMLLWQRTRY